MVKYPFSYYISMVHTYVYTLPKTEVFYFRDLACKGITDY